MLGIIGISMVIFGVCNSIFDTLSGTAIVSGIVIFFVGLIMHGQR